MNRQSHIILVTGGQRSGKSENAERLALDLSPTPVYIATCTPMDEEMERRVEIHRKRREGQGWTTIEAPDLDSVPPLPGATVLIDSATMLASNSFLHTERTTMLLWPICRRPSTLLPAARMERL